MSTITEIQKAIRRLPADEKSALAARKSLQRTIKATHGCDSRHVESVPVHEVFRGQTAWKETVEVFDLLGHERAKRACAWQYEDGDETKTVAVLEIPPVNSPQSAVQVAIVAKAMR